METKEFFNRTKKQYKKLGITTQQQFAKKIGYSTQTGLKNFYRRGVTDRAVKSLLMIEKLSKEDLEDIYS